MPDSIPMTPSDIDDVLDLWRDMPGVGLSESDTPDCLSAYINRNPDLSLIIRDGRSVIAAVLCGHDGRRGYLHHLAVAAEHRGHGLGRMLVAECLTRLGRLGIQKCNIFVYADNDDGTAFWQKSGWQGRDDLRVMQRPIAELSGQRRLDSFSTGPAARPDCDPTIIRATPEHIDVVALLFDAYRQFYGQSPAPDSARDFVLERMRRDESVVLLAMCDATACGFTQLYPAFSSVSMYRTWILNDLFVAPESRRNGIGRALVEAATDFAKASGARRLVLCTEVDNHSAQALYEQTGWAKDDAFVYYKRQV